MISNYLILTKHYGEDIIFALFLDGKTETERSHSYPTSETGFHPRLSNIRIHALYHDLHLYTSTLHIYFFKEYIWVNPYIKAVQFAL